MAHRMFRPKGEKKSPSIHPHNHPHEASDIKVSGKFPYTAESTQSASFGIAKVKRHRDKSQPALLDVMADGSLPIQLSLF